MNPFIEKFIAYMSEVRNAGENTLLAYQRDLCKLEKYLLDSGASDIKSATSTALMAYVLHLHKSGKHAATVSRNIAVIKNFYKHLYYEREIAQDPALILRSPKVVPRVSPTKLSRSDREKLMSTAPEDLPDARDIRDRAISALISCSQVRSGKVIELNISDVDTDAKTISYRNGNKVSVANLEPHVCDALVTYIKTSRPDLLKNCENVHEKALFLNLSGKRLSRQGLWKIIKDYGRRSQLDADLSPKLLKDSKK